MFVDKIFDYPNVNNQEFTENIKDFLIYEGKELDNLYNVVNGECILKYKGKQYNVEVVSELKT